MVKGNKKRRYYHTSSVVKMNPWFVTGFSDAEASFSLNINKDTSNKFGLKVQIIFQIGLHKKDKALLEQIQSFLV